MEAIVLAGGLGTRLRSEVAELPKSMAAINSRPFLEYLMDHLIQQGISRVVFSVGYKSEHIEAHFGTAYRNCEVTYAREESPLGTGGAIRLALGQIQGETAFIVNGDSLFLANLAELQAAHTRAGAAVTLALKPMQDFERYGTVDMDDQGRILRFNEKQPTAAGLINAGVYLFDVAAFQALSFPEKFSIEKEFFETHLDALHFQGVPSNRYFLDIGIPRDFHRAQVEIGVFPTVDRSWTLFLDRDGVINRKRDNDYVKKLEELELLPGAVESIAALSHRFGRVLVVTNQQGIGKGLMTEAALLEVHEHIDEQVKACGGTIDAFYHAPQLAAEQSNMRKPGTGMGLKARKDFPDIDFGRSIMVGDSPSDMEFGRALGMTTVFIHSETGTDHQGYTVPTLAAWAALIDSMFPAETTAP